MGELPQSVRVGYRIYKIIKWEPREAAGKSRYGECSSTAQIIKVDTAFGARQASNTLLHEILHASYNNAELQKNDDEERVVSSLANQLTQVMQDNPEVFEYLLASAKESPHE